MKMTMKARLRKACDFFMKHSKIVFPILLIAAVAVTITIALDTDSVSGNLLDINGVTDVTGGTVNAEGNVNTPEDTTEGVFVPDVEFELNAYPDVNQLIATYYQAKADGDAEVVAQIQSTMDDMEKIKIQEFGKYIESYPMIDVYTKPGPIENSYFVIAYTHVVMSYYPDDTLAGYETLYVCTAEDGSLYINNGEVSDEVFEYIRQMLLKEDVVELCNTIKVEYNDTCLFKPELYQYISLIDEQVQISVGVILAQQIQQETGESDVSGGDVSGGDVSGGDVTGGGTEESGGSVIQIEMYANTTATVNVRTSASEEADKLGQIAGGKRVQVLEQLVNGWSKIIFEGQEAYIMTQYLQVVESAGQVEVIGKVTATTTVNVRAAASTSSTKLGAITKGTSVDLIAYEGDWCKILYEGQVAYVSADYVK